MNNLIRIFRRFGSDAVASFHRFLFRLYDFYFRMTRHHRCYDFSHDASHESPIVGRYSSVSILQTRRAIGALGSVSGLIFCDIGCGKGRVLFVAAEFPFTRIIGIELFKDFAEVGKRNLEQWRTSGGRDCISLYCDDATDFTYLAEATMYYFFNPFSAAIFEKVLDRIEACGQRNRVLLLVVHPVSEAYMNVLRTRPYRLVRVLEYGFSRSFVYERVYPESAVGSGLPMQQV